MANFAALVPLIEQLSGGSDRPPFRHFSAPIGPDERPTGTHPFRKSGRDARALADKQFQQQGKTSRAFFDVQRDKADAAAIAGLGKLTKVAVAAAKPLLALAAAKELATLPNKIAQWGESLIESQRNLGQFSGTIARSLGEFERRKLLRTIDTAGGTAKSTEFLTESISDLRDSLQPMAIAVTNLTNTVAALSASAVMPTLRTIHRSLKLTNKYYAIIGPLLEVLVDRLGAQQESRDLGPFQDFIREAKDNGLEPFVPMPRN